MGGGSHLVADLLLQSAKIARKIAPYDGDNG